MPGGHRANNPSSAQNQYDPRAAASAGPIAASPPTKSGIAHGDGAQGVAKPQAHFAMEDTALRVHPRKPG